MLQIMVFNPMVQQLKQKIAPLDMAIVGFQVMGHRTPTNNNIADGNALGPRLQFLVDEVLRFDNIPAAPYFYPYYFDKPMTVRKDSLMEFNFIDAPISPAVLATDPPILLIEWQPLHMVKKHGNTYLKHFRVDTVTTHVNFDLFPRFHNRVNSMFLFEDNNAVVPGAASYVIQFPTINSLVPANGNEWSFKLQISGGTNGLLLDEGQMQFWRWGSFRRQVNQAAGAPAAEIRLLPELRRRRFFPGILVKPNHQFMADRRLPIPPAVVNNFTNFMFECEYLSPQDMERERLAALEASRRKTAGPQPMLPNRMLPARPQPRQAGRA